MLVRRTIRLVLALASACLSAPAFAVQGAESSATCVEGSEPLLLGYGQYTVSCQINTPTDIDQFQLVGAAGDLLRITLRGSGCLDPKLELRAPSSALVPLSSNSCGTDVFCSGCTIVGTTTLTETGIHSLIVFDVPNNDTGTYVLQIERVPPVGPALPLVYGSTMADQLNPSTDVDFYSFSGEAGTLVRILGTASGCLDPRVRVLDPAGMPLTPTSGGLDCNTDVFCSGCTVSADFTLPLTGDYLAYVYDEGANDTGSYSYSLNCLFGTCPPPAGSCFGDSSCPCANAGDPGHGCAHSSSTRGALLSASGTSSTTSDSALLTASNLPSNAATLFFQGELQTPPAPFGDGLLCLGGAIRRLGATSAAGGVAQYPRLGDRRISVQGAIPGAGASRSYQAWYRDGGSFCTAATHNLSNAVELVWAP